MIELFSLQFSFFVAKLSGRITRWGDHTNSGRPWVRKELGRNDRCGVSALVGRERRSEPLCSAIINEAGLYTSFLLPSHPPYMRIVYVYWYMDIDIGNISWTVYVYNLYIDSMLYMIDCRGLRGYVRVWWPMGVAVHPPWVYSGNVLGLLGFPHNMVM